MPRNLNDRKEQTTSNRGDKRIGTRLWCPCVANLTRFDRIGTGEAQTSVAAVGLNLRAFLGEEAHGQLAAGVFTYSSLGRYAHSRQAAERPKHRPDGSHAVHDGGFLRAVQQCPSRGLPL